MSTAVVKKNTNRLNKITKVIHSEEEKAKKSFFTICRNLALVENEKLAVECGYKNTADYARDNFGYSYSTAKNYINIGSKFLTEVNGTVATICVDQETGKDYNLGQLNVMGKLSADEFKDYHEREVISPDMSRADIKHNIAVERGEVKEDVVETTAETVETTAETVSDTVDGTIESVNETPEIGSKRVLDAICTIAGTSGVDLVHIAREIKDISEPDVVQELLRTVRSARFVLDTFASQLS